jgi:hypothetical protein
MESDCSQRICQFNLAHVDTPKGDLDSSSGALSGPDDSLLEYSFLYPYGTTEQYPAMTDSRGNILANTAHYYMECSNKGICDRSTGTCACFVGYEGSACQRASCPTTASGVCSGHGTCETIKTLAALDNNNVYKLWDEHATLGCKCDGGFTGSDCSEQICKYGADPLFFDDYNNVRYANFTYEIFTTSQTTISGNYSIIFTDHYGEDWETGPIDIEASCDFITDALEALPNKAIPSGSVLCYQYNIFNYAIPTAAVGAEVNVNNYYISGILGLTGPTSNGDVSDKPLAKYTLVFTGNPGYIPQFTINKYLDGYRPTLYTAEPSDSTLGWHIYANGFHGEDDDLVPDLCDGVLVYIQDYDSAGTTWDQLVVVDNIQGTKKFKTCLGDSDGDSTNNVDVYNWDYGNQAPQFYVNTQEKDISAFNNTLQNPHLIKLVDATQDYDLDYGEDPATRIYPISRLCSSMTNELTFDGGIADSNYKYDDLTSGDGPNRNGWCWNKDPPGFYAVIYFDGDKFNIITNPASSGDYNYGQDFSQGDTPTTFHVFTTTGYLQKVSTIAGLYSYESSSQKFSAATPQEAMYSNTLYFSSFDKDDTDDTGDDKLDIEKYTGLSSLTPYLGNIDCETNPTGANFTRDCINKEDRVMFLNNDATIGATYNPYYPNLYTVKKISREERQGQDFSLETFRHQIVVDYGVNSIFTYDNPGHVYKFHPPADTKKYNYVAQCSNRGICDSGSGTCQCFPGYTNDNCDTQNALAK